MIQFALLYGLGFLSAALVAMLLAPAIHQRIVHFTETRLKATMPLSPQEIRAQKDLARAAYAAENARTMQDLIREREKSVDLQMQTDALSREAGRLAGDGEVMKGRLEEMEVDASRLRAEALRHQNEVVTFAEAVRRQEELSAGKDVEIEDLGQQVRTLASTIDELKIGNSTLGTEVEHLKSRIQSLRDEREELRRENRLTTQRAKDAEQRLIQEEHTRLRLDDRLGRQMAESADKEQLLERRMREIAQLKERLRRATTDARAAHRALQEANLPVPDLQADARGEQEPIALPPPQKAAEAEDRLGPSTPASTAADRQKLADELHHRQTALTELLLKATTASNDDALRNEVADIAAGMIVLSAMQDGRGSAVDDILSTKTTRRDNGKRITLAERARKRKIDMDRAQGSGGSA
ncbi:hypothetical protein [Rhizobium halophytocola]|uniref:Chromosome segregation ATPase n=1 Tax=Rhizobium halophytocola TaxID=735519 RepID=A0ABS4DSQ5_9HYPH|nr:hypothetical protein [Rhizobium halophytocola]MBP1848724.1 chromosome segregation ATPase [Rhizobium halophytocola]